MNPADIFEVQSRGDNFISDLLRLRNDHKFVCSSNLKDLYTFLCFLNCILVFPFLYRKICFNIQLAPIKVWY